MSSESQSNRAAGSAAFALALFIVCVIAVAALDRAGAPDRLVRALGPVLALVALGVLGIGARTTRLPLFIGAGRRVPSFYAALAVAAAAAGVAVSLGLWAAPATNPVWPGAMVGTALGAAALAPLIRRFGAASLSDVIATRFTNPLVRAASGIAIAAAAALAALAGYRTAVAVVETLAAAHRSSAETLVAAALWLCVAPGGFASAVWTAAAAGGGVVLLALVGLVFPLPLDVASGAAEAGEAIALPLLTSPEAVAAFVAAGVGAALLTVAAPPAAGCQSAAAAAISGFGGILVFITLAAVTLGGAPVLTVGSRLADAGPLAASFAGAATLASAMALASLGVLGTSRAFGVALGRPPRPFSTLASVRLARLRAAHAAIVVGCALADGAGFIDPPAALVAAFALGAAVTAPIAALAAIPRAGPLAASAATLAATGAAVVAATRFMAGGAGLAAADLPPAALAIGAGSFVVGSLVALVAPRRAPAPAPGPFDPFADPSG